ncbi:MAG: hypothetical protein CM1200mP28_04510 [Deltaproteobacteria bacterium]|nr:MAG: hypothetical protein CM1200mP28_04510 [Deltaproteobacteria bacterium]
MVANMKFNYAPERESDMDEPLLKQEYSNHYQMILMIQ